MQGAYAGSTIRITCNTKNNVKWTKDGGDMPSYAKYRMEPNLIKIENVKEVDSGFYGCKFSNQGRIITATSELRVGSKFLIIIYYDKPLHLLRICFG